MGPCLRRPHFFSLQFQLIGLAWKAAPHFFGLYVLMSPETMELLLHSSASFPFPVIVSLAANLRTDMVFKTMLSSVLLLIVLPPRLLSTELRSIRTPTPVLPEIVIPPSM